MLRLFRSKLFPCYPEFPASPVPSGAIRLGAGWTDTGAQPGDRVVKGDREVTPFLDLSYASLRHGVSVHGEETTVQEANVIVPILRQWVESGQGAIVFDENGSLRRVIVEITEQHRRHLKVVGLGGAPLRADPAELLLRAIEVAAATGFTFGTSEYFRLMALRILRLLLASEQLRSPLDAMTRLHSPTTLRPSFAAAPDNPQLTPEERSQAEALSHMADESFAAALSVAQFMLEAVLTPQVNALIGDATSETANIRSSLRNGDVIYVDACHARTRPIVHALLLHHLEQHATSETPRTMALMGAGDDYAEQHLARIVANTDRSIFPVLNGYTAHPGLARTHLWMCPTSYSLADFQARRIRKAYPDTEYRTPFTSTGWLFHAPWHSFVAQVFDGTTMLPPRRAHLLTARLDRGDLP